MNRSYYLVYDFETGSKFPHTTQPTQIAAAVIDNKKLEVVSRFDSYFQPLPEDIREKHSLDPIGEEALEKTKIKMETLVAAPPPKVVWEQFSNWVNQYNFKKSKWDAPVRVGYNIVGFDDIIVNRLCGEEPYKYGNYDDERRQTTLFHPIYHVDLLQTTFLWFENKIEPKSLSFDSLRQYFGMANEAGHNAVYDVDQTGQLFIRYMKLIRKISPITKFKNSFVESKNNADI